MIASAVSPLLLLLVLACPLMMVFMMRGGHGHGSHAGGHGAHHGGADDTAQKQASLDELRERRDELDAQIQSLEDQDRYQSTAAR